MRQIFELLQLIEKKWPIARMGQDFKGQHHILIDRETGQFTLYIWMYPDHDVIVVTMEDADLDLTPEQAMWEIDRAERVRLHGHGVRN